MATRDEIDSLIDWWRTSGVDTIVADRPQSWLEADVPPNKAPVSPAAVETIQGPDAYIPDDLAAFRLWLKQAADLPGEPPMRVDSDGDPASGLMLLVDMPEPGDRESAKLLSGDVGQLLDRMLAAIGRDRQSAYIAALCPVSLTGTRIDDDAMTSLTRAARRHIALAAPKLLLLMGEASSRALCGSNLAKARGSLLTINHDDGTIPAIATFHPRFLLQHPGFKAESWKDLQLLLDEINR